MLQMLCKLFCATSVFEVFFSQTSPYLANGPWNKSLNSIFPTKYVIPKSLKG